MAETITIAATSRTATGKGGARATRREGRIPGIIYGAKSEPTPIAVGRKELEREITRTTFFSTLVELDLDGRRERVIPRDIQLDPVTDRPLHVDFMRVSGDTRISVMVPVLFVNDDASPGLKRGGVLNVVRHEIEFLCAVDDIPAAITVDLAGRDIGDSIHVSHVALPANATLAITDRDFTIATIAVPSSGVEPKAAETEE